MTEEITETQLEEEFQSSTDEAPSAEESPPEAPPPVASQPQSFEVAGRQLTPDELEPIVRFSDWARANPQRWEEMTRWERGELQFVPVDQPQQTAETSPDNEWMDYDPAYKKFDERLSAHEKWIASREQSENVAAVDGGLEEFFGSHKNLTPEQTGQIMQWVHDRKLLTTIPGNLPLNVKAAEVAKRFEEARRVVLYDQQRSDGERAVVSDIAARRRAASTQSSAVSAPRTEPVPTNSQERLEAMAREIAEAQQS